jgi:hypothetical protein
VARIWLIPLVALGLKRVLPMKNSLKCALVAAFLLVGGSAARSAQATNEPAKIALTGHRFLFVVETSSQSRRFEAANRQAVFNLVLGGLFGQMRTGDTFGLWTYNDEVHPGDFPVTVWDSERTLELAGQVAAYLQKQKYARQADSVKLVASLRELSDRVGDFNVFIVSTGRDAMAGTPFDQNVNAAYEVYAKRPGPLMKVPIITSFFVRKGRPIRSSVVLAGEKITLPERPVTLPRRALEGTNATNVVANSVKASPAPEDSSTASPPLPSGAVVASTSAASSLATSNAAPARPLRKVMQIITKTNSSPKLDSSLASSTSDTPLPGEIPSSPEPSPTTPAPASVPIAAVASPDGPVSPGTKDSVASNDAITTGLIEARPGTGNATVPGPIMNLALRPSATAGPTASSTPDAPSSLLPEPRVPVSSSFSGAPMTVAARERGTDQASGQTATPSLPAMSAAALPPPAGLPAGVMLAIGGVLFAAAGFLLVVVLRRQPPSRGSLITQSMGTAPTRGDLVVRPD